MICCEGVCWGAILKIKNWDRDPKTDSKEISKAVPLGDKEALEAAWTASDEYTARIKAGKERLSKHKNAKAENKKAALAQ